eukprot:752723-Rhodomonas_salina.1
MLCHAMWRGVLQHATRTWKDLTSSLSVASSAPSAISSSGRCAIASAHTSAVSAPLASHREHTLRRHSPARAA